MTVPLAAAVAADTPMHERVVDAEIRLPFSRSRLICLETSAFLQKFAQTPFVQQHLGLFKQYLATLACFQDIDNKLILPWLYQSDALALFVRTHQLLGVNACQKLDASFCASLETPGDQLKVDELPNRRL